MGMPFDVPDLMTVRFKLVQDHRSGRYKVSELAGKYGVSRPTVYKWLERFEEGGKQALADLPSDPLSSPRKTPKVIEKKILKLKREHVYWGAPIIRDLLRLEIGERRTPSVTTVGKILKSHGLTFPPKRKNRSAHTPSGELTAGESPNHVWCIDFKGNFQTSLEGICTPLTITDHCSRYLLCAQGMSAELGAVAVKPIIERRFVEFGLPEIIRSDNGPPFSSLGLAGLSELAVWWIELDIRPERTRPGKPQDNGQHERFHRTMKHESINPAAPTQRRQQKQFDEFRERFNEVRPHRSLGMHRPAELYRRSTREYRASAIYDEHDYPAGWTVRRIGEAHGNVRLGGYQFWLNHTLQGRSVGFRPMGDGEWDVYFREYRIAQIDERLGEMRTSKYLIRGIEDGVMKVAKKVPLRRS